MPAVRALDATSKRRELRGLDRRAVASASPPPRHSPATAPHSVSEDAVQTPPVWNGMLRYIVLECGGIMVLAAPAPHQGRCAGRRRAAGGGGFSRARKKRAQARQNLTASQIAAAARLANSANIEANDTKYKRTDIRFPAEDRPVRGRVLRVARPLFRSPAPSARLRWGQPAFGLASDRSGDKNSPALQVRTLPMLHWFQALMPKEEKFFELFAEHSRAVVAGAVALRAMMEGGEALKRNYQTVMDREDDADNATRDVLIAVRRTFITPFDRGNIRDLITSMDNAIDQMQKTAKAIQLFDVTTFTQQMKDMADIIVKCAELVQEAVPLLESIGSQAARISSISEQISALEGQADEMHDKGVHASYRAALNGNPLDFFVGNEVYDHLEKVVDRFDDVANILHGIVIEHV